MRRLTSTSADFILEVSPEGLLLAASRTIEDRLVGTSRSARRQASASRWPTTRSAPLSDGC
jgi:hypothetical protein